jgi:hypothetical protein
VQDINDLSKRLRVITTELDDFKKTIEPTQNIIMQRLDAVETKAQEVWLDMEANQMKKAQGNAGNMTNEEMIQAEIKGMQNSLFAAKSHLSKRLDDLREEIESAFALCSNDVVEAKLTERMNEAIQMLTRQSADRIETKKNIRIIER